MQPGRNYFSVFGQNARAFFQDLNHRLVAVGCCFTNDGRQHCDFHFVGCLRPAHEFVEIIQRQSAQNTRGKLRFAAVHVVFAQNEAQRLDRNEITAAGVAEDMPPAARFFDVIATTTGDG